MAKFKHRDGDQARMTREKRKRSQRNFPFDKWKTIDI